jgi:hypothetical protein
VYVRYLGGQRNLSINTQALEEALEALKEFDESIVARSDILRRLRGIGLIGGSKDSERKYTHRKKNPDPRIDNAYRGERLQNNFRIQVVY